MIYLNIAFVSAESAPFIKVGGLADVVGSLPKALKGEGVNVRVFIPGYKDIPDKYKSASGYCCDISVRLNEHLRYCSIESLDHDGVTFYLINNDRYYRREGIYGFADDAERFVFFCKAVLESFPHIKYFPDIIHCHDWHTGLICLYLKSQYRDKETYENIKTVYSIHNLAYQGIFPYEMLKDPVGLSDDYFNIEGIEYYGKLNFMKGGLNYADAITTVSPTYSKEIQTSQYGYGLDGLLKKRSGDLLGILNGIDYDIYNPDNDPAIFENYGLSCQSGHKTRLCGFDEYAGLNDIDNENNGSTGESETDTAIDTLLQKKGVNKTELQKLLNLPVNAEVPLIGVVSRLVDQKGFNLIEDVFDEIVACDIQIVVLGTGDPRYESFFKKAASTHPEKISTNILFDDTLAHRIYAGSDMFLMPSLFEPCGIGQLIALKYGTVPIVRETGGLKDTVIPYNEYTRSGNGFSFAGFNGKDMLFTIKRALSFFEDKDCWNEIVIAAMSTDNSWKSSAQRYRDLYTRLLS